MALVEKDFELIDDYLANRMNASEKATFEERLKNESALSEECTHQQNFIEGIRQARVTQLKSMLNSIPVTSVPPSQTAMLTKIGGWIAVTGLVVTATYFIVTKDNTSGQPEQTEPVKNEVLVEKPAETPIQPEDEKAETESPGTTSPENKSTKPVVTKNEPVEIRPTIQAYDPSTEIDETVQKYEAEQLELISNAFVTSSMEVETNRADKKYDFHYVFNADRLVLYGAFEKHLYEILEFISGDKKTVVLYYRSNYYLLDTSKSTPTRLAPIQNKELLKKLKEHRGN